jgi:putative hydrolase of HD superfamily
VRSQQLTSRWRPADNAPALPGQQLCTQHKRFKRTGWSTAGVPAPESVADHSVRVSVIAGVLPAMEGVDPQRASFLALWHDSQETRSTDLPHLSKKYVTVATNEQVTADQVRPLPGPVAAMITAAVAEYEAGHTAETRCARDADQLDYLLYYSCGSCCGV